MKTKFIVAAVALAAITGAAVVWAQDDTPVQAGLFDYTNVEATLRGEAIYAENCASCHGADLEGQPDWRTPAANGRALAPPHDESGHTWHHPDAQLFQIVKFGTAAMVGNGYESDMAGYEAVLTDAEILDVMAYIKSTWPSEIIERHDAMNAATN